MEKSQFKSHSLSVVGAFAIVSMVAAVAHSGVQGSTDQEKAQVGYLDGNVRYEQLPTGSEDSSGQIVKFFVGPAEGKGLFSKVGLHEKNRFAGLYDEFSDSHVYEGKPSPAQAVSPVESVQTEKGVNYTVEKVDPKSSWLDVEKHFKLPITGKNEADLSPWLGRISEAHRSLYAVVIKLPEKANSADVKSDLGYSLRFEYPQSQSRCEAFLDKWLEYWGKHNTRTIFGGLEVNDGADALPEPVKSVVSTDPDLLESNITVQPTPIYRHFGSCGQKKGMALDASTHDKMADVELAFNFMDGDMLYTNKGDRLQPRKSASSWNPCETAQSHAAASSKGVDVKLASARESQSQ